MNNDEISKYKEYVFKMSDDQLDAESLEVVRQSLSIHNRDCYHSMLIQLCFNEWKNRGQETRFLKAYNKAVNK